jgi:hypothetical protein
MTAAGNVVQQVDNNKACGFRSTIRMDAPFQTKKYPKDHAIPVRDKNGAKYFRLFRENIKTERKYVNGNKILQNENIYSLTKTKQQFLANMRGNKNSVSD